MIKNTNVRSPSFKQTHMKFVCLLNKRKLSYLVHRSRRVKTIGDAISDNYEVLRITCMEVESSSRRRYLIIVTIRTKAKNPCTAFMKEIDQQIQPCSLRLRSSKYISIGFTRFFVKLSNVNTKLHS